MFIQNAAVHRVFQLLHRISFCLICSLKNNTSSLLSWTSTRLLSIRIGRCETFAVINSPDNRELILWIIDLFQDVGYQGSLSFVPETGFPLKSSLSFAGLGMSCLLLWCAQQLSLSRLSNVSKLILDLIVPVVCSEIEVGEHLRDLELSLFWNSWLSTMNSLYIPIN